MHFLDFWWCIQYAIQQPWQLFQLLKSGSSPLESHNQSSMIEVRPLLIEFVNWTKELGITLRRRTAHSRWTNGKNETQNQYIARYWRNFLNDAGNNWSSLAPKFAFAQNTSVNYTIGETAYKIVFGTKPQISMSLKLGLCRKKHKLCCSNFCKDLPSHSHSENSLKNELLDNHHQPQLSQALLERTTIQTNLFINLSTMPRTDCTITRLSQSLQAGTPPRSRTESTLRKSQTRPYTKPETSTAKAWTLYRYQAYDEYHLSNSGR